MKRIKYIGLGTILNWFFIVIISGLNSKFNVSYFNTYITVTTILLFCIIFLIYSKKYKKKIKTIDPKWAIKKLGYILYSYFYYRVLLFDYTGIKSSSIFIIINILISFLASLFQNSLLSGEIKLFSNTKHEWDAITPRGDIKLRKLAFTTLIIAYSITLIFLIWLVFAPLKNAPAKDDIMWLNMISVSGIISGLNFLAWYSICGGIKELIYLFKYCK